MTTTTDVYTAEPGQRIPVDPPAPAPARPAAVDPATGRPRRTTTRRKTGVKPVHVVVGTGATAVVGLSAALIGGPAAWVAAALAAGIPLTVAARMTSRRRRAGGGRRTSYRRWPGSGRRSPFGNSSRGSTISGLLSGGIPGLPKSNKTGRSGKSTASRAGTTGTTGSRAAGKMGLPKIGPKTTGAKGAAAAGSKTSSGPKTSAKGAAGTRPKTGSGTESTGRRKDRGRGTAGAAGPGGAPAGGKRRRRGTSTATGPGAHPGTGPRGSRRRGRGTAAGAGVTTGGGARRASKTAGGKGKAGGRKHGTNGSAPLRTRKPLRTPRTRIGAAMQRKRIADQDMYLRKLGRLQKAAGDVPSRAAKAARVKARKAAAATGRATKAASGNVGKTAAAGFKAGGTARNAARAAWNARKAGRVTRMQRARGLAVGAFGAAGAYAARATTNGAVKAHKKMVVPAARWAKTQSKKAVQATARAARRRAAKIRRAAANRGLAAWQVIRSRIQRHRPAAAPAVTTPVPAQQTNAGPGIGPLTNFIHPTTFTNPAHVTTSAGAGTRTIGGSPMAPIARSFAPYARAVDAAAALYKWTPGSGEGALFAFYDALDGFIAGAGSVREGIANMVEKTKQDLGGHLNKAHIKSMDDVVKKYWHAEEVVKGVKHRFQKIHEHDLHRRATANAQVTNVPVAAVGEVNAHFDPRGPMEQYGKSLGRWSPGRTSGALFIWGGGIPGLKASSWLIANGMRNMVDNVTEDLAGGLEALMAEALTEIYRDYRSAALAVQELESSWHRAHAPDIQRAERRGAHTANVR